MLSNRSRGTLMSYTDHSAQCRFKSYTPISSFTTFLGSVLRGMQSLNWDTANDHENGEESAQNYTGGSCQSSQGSWGHSHQENNW